MSAEDLNLWLSGENSLYAHLAVFISLLLGGVGFPIPEDIPLLLSGLAASKGVVSLKSIFGTCYVGVVLADQIVYALGYYFGPTLLEFAKNSRVFPGVNDEKVENIREGLRRRSFACIFLGRHLFPLRSATFLTAGALRIPFIEFFVADAIAAFISVGAMVGMGYWLGGVLSPDMIEQLSSKLHLYVTVALLVTLGLYLLKKIVLEKFFYRSKDKL